MHVDFLAPYPDFFSFLVVLLLAVLLSVGVKESSIMNNIFTTINLATVILVIGTGVFKGITVSKPITKCMLVWFWFSVFLCDYSILNFGCSFDNY